MSQLKHWAVVTPDDCVGKSKSGASAIFDEEEAAQKCLDAHPEGYRLVVLYVLSEVEYTSLKDD